MTMMPFVIVVLDRRILRCQSPDYLRGQACAEVLQLRFLLMISAWERNVDFKLLSHEEELATDSIVAQWIQFYQNAALCAYADILEDGLELPNSSGPRAEEGGAVLDGMYAQGCMTMEESRIRGRPGRAGPAGIVSKDGWIMPT
jgi:hypothetical protein